MKFEIGDVVCLKSGGPDMSVEQVTNDEIVCIWFDEGRRIKERAFDPRLLEVGGKGRGVVHLTIEGVSPLGSVASA